MTGDDRDVALLGDLIERSFGPGVDADLRRERAGLEGHDRAASAGLPVEERSALFEALQALPVMQRKTVVLRYWLGMSVQETARELAISEGTVKSHASRGLASLQRVLAGT